VEGETLKQRCGMGPLPNSESARHRPAAFCAGVSEAHRKGSDHRDLKPSNVILKPGTDGVRAVITDFGLAGSPEAALEAAKLGVVSGTPAYRRRNCGRGSQPQWRPTSFALGLILYEMDQRLHAAVRAFRSPGRVYAYDPVRLRPRAHGNSVCGNGLPPVSPQWDRILGRCLELDPARRFSMSRNRGRSGTILARGAGCFAVASAAVLAVTTVSSLMKGRWHREKVVWRSAGGGGFCKCVVRADSYVRPGGNCGDTRPAPDPLHAGESRSRSNRNNPNRITMHCEFALRIIPARRRAATESRCTPGDDARRKCTCESGSADYALRIWHFRAAGAGWCGDLDLRVARRAGGAKMRDLAREAV